jgi:hypothetical protein
MPLNGYTANLPNDILLDTGVLYVGSTPIGASRGAWKVELAWSVENVDFDGKYADVKGLDRKFYGPSSMSATLIELGPATHGNQISKMEAGATSVDTGSTPSTLTTITPKPGGALYASGDYLTNVRVVFERAITVAAGAKKYVAVLFPAGLVRKWGPLTGTDKKEATYDVEIAARKDMASGTTADAPYLIEYREALP